MTTATLARNRIPFRLHTHQAWDDQGLGITSQVCPVNYPAHLGDPAALAGDATSTRHQRLTLRNAGDGRRNDDSPRRVVQRVLSPSTWGSRLRASRRRVSGLSLASTTDLRKFRPPV